MKHASAQTLEQIASILKWIRTLPGLREKKPGVFYYRSKAFLHFHEDPAGIFADVRPSDTWMRLPFNSSEEQHMLRQTLTEILSDHG